MTATECRPPVGTPDETTPDWCDYPYPTTPDLGCWSLLDGRITKPQDCNDCDCAAWNRQWHHISIPPDTPRGRISGESEPPPAPAVSAAGSPTETAGLDTTALEEPK